MKPITRLRFAGGWGSATIDCEMTAAIQRAMEEAKKNAHPDDTVEWGAPTEIEEGDDEHTIGKTETMVIGRIGELAGHEGDDK